MGIEKAIPRFRDLEVFLQLLPRSATGERMNPYTSLWTGVRAGDGPRRFHLVLLDAGRTRVLADPSGRAALRCIRCSACINVCPVYRQTGGHAYHTRTRPINRHPGASRASAVQCVAAVRVVALRRLLRRLPGRDRHSVDPRARAREGRWRAGRGRGSRAEGVGRLRRGGYERGQRLALAAAALRPCSWIRVSTGPLSAWGGRATCGLPAEPSASGGSPVSARERCSAASASRPTALRPPPGATA
jgi:ferredoxin